jgi:hypothetical protein
MPDTQDREYNPLIIGYSCNQGPLSIPLNEARNQFGQLPSRYDIISKKTVELKRKRTETLNLKLGHLVTELLEKDKINLKWEVYKFYSQWHRNLEEEFKIQTAPFFNINKTDSLRELIQENKIIIDQFSNIDIKQHLLDSGLFKKGVIETITSVRGTSNKEEPPPEFLLEKSSKILQRRIKGVNNSDKYSQIQKMLSDLKNHEIMMDIKKLTGEKLLSLNDDMIICFTDEICSCLSEFNKYTPLKKIETLNVKTGKGIEFEYATRDRSYLTLGKKTSDCTADKRTFQADENIENIYWTVFSWILDRNYQILKVYFNDEFVMKAHLLPIFIFNTDANFEFKTISPKKSNYIILAIDAIETTTAFRGQSEEAKNNHLAGHRDEIFSKTINFIKKIAEDMNITDIYAERFSNTLWVREKLETYPEIFHHVNHISKIDQLEDVYSLSEELSTKKNSGHGVPEEVFMEIQMKNTLLQSGYFNKVSGVKSFGVIRGDALDGIPMNRVCGI